MRSHTRTLVLFLTILGLVGLQLACTSEPASDTEHVAETKAVATDAEAMTEEQALHKADPNGSYGAGLSLHTQTSLAELLADPAAYEGKKVQVRGIVKEVCPKRGCWIQLAEKADAEDIRVKVTDGEIVFPLSALNATAIVEGTVERIEMDLEQTRAWEQHMAEERGETFDPNSVTGPSTTWRIVGEGAKITS